jgi:hypothetical protein
VQRAVTAVVAGWCVVPVCWSAALYLYSRMYSGAGASEFDSAGSLLSSIVPVMAATLGFIATAAVVSNYIPDSWLRTIQILDVIGVALPAWWLIAVLQNKTMHLPPQGRLEIELRAPKELLPKTLSIDKDAARRVQVYFGNGRAVETRHADRIREEGDSAILPVDMEIFEHRGWSVVVRRNTDVRHNFWDRYWFELPPAESPSGETPWSGWIKPVRKNGWDVANDVAVRCRWVAKS